MYCRICSKIKLNETLFPLFGQESEKTFKIDWRASFYYIRETAGISNLVCVECRELMEYVLIYHEKCLNNELNLQAGLRMQERRTKLKEFEEFEESNQGTDSKINSSVQQESDEDSAEEEDEIVQDNEHEPSSSSCLELEESEQGENHLDNDNGGSKENGQFENSFAGSDDKISEIIGTSMVLVAEYKFQCSICGRPIQKKSSLKNHIVTHSRRNLNCRICNKSFKSETLLLKHEQAHEYVNKNECPHEGCTKRFSTKWDLNIHIRAVHLGYRYKCSACGKENKYKRNISRHIKKVHEYEVNMLPLLIKPNEEAS